LDRYIAWSHVDSSSSYVDWRQEQRRAQLGPDSAGETADSLSSDSSDSILSQSLPPHHLPPVMVAGYDLRDTLDAPLSIMRGLMERYG